MAMAEGKQSMVAKHRQKLYDTKFSKADKALKRRVPEVHALTRAHALDYADLDVETAERLLSMFLRREEERGERKRARGARGGEAEEDEGARRKHRRRRRHRDRDGDRKGSNRDEGEVYGKYGILKESDLNGDKRTEFMLWANEVKSVEVESLARWEEKKMFGEFMDLYNTATLPSTKYYNLDAWRYEQAKAREAGDGDAGGGGEKVVFNDEEERKRELERERNSTKNQKIEAARRDLLASGKLSMMREQERLRAAQQVAYKTGDMKQARDIADILRPNEKDEIEFDMKTGQYRKKSKLNG
ncbi:hypothetical protein HOP50_02g13720 [Chloropicon primus]|uniref:Uncharacterized protein n=1 Tax=Chloropicon primus TaxID=1764295 RepID=A0A5B8MEQ0_9CHLO|nr:hypothetical protein A3770_02p13850 [Chloropicon primus]UPQ98074.1 hypothetical protein HOP50_02g13720 [Chloropicon primus]|eukprot:QDZ18867.1 hypothetical protein A3770_02p13850 [Chloropicon primus]